MLHLGAGHYAPDDTSHSTFEIWRELASGFRRYTVLGRSMQAMRSSFSSDGVDVHLLASKLSSEAEFLFTQFSAIPLADAVKADVVVAQCPVQGGLAAARIAKRRGAKILLEFHMAHYFEDKPFWSRHNLLEALTRIALPHAHRIRVLSEGMRQRLLARFGQRYAERTVVLPPRVDLSRFSTIKRDWQIGPRAKVVLVGSVNERKGQLRFLRSVLPALANIDVWIVGTGPDLQACRAYVQQVGADDRVTFFGQMDHAQLAQVLPQADIMVLFSRMEGTPRAIMEGMAVGLPIVTTNAGFCADVVAHDVQGYVLGNEPEKEVVPCLQSLLGSEALRARMGLAGRARAENEFESGMLYDRYRQLIRETFDA